jgi:hypothetical protein
VNAANRTLTVFPAHEGFYGLLHALRAEAGVPDVDTIASKSVAAAGRMLTPKTVAQVLDCNPQVSWSAYEATLLVLGATPAVLNKAKVLYEQVRSSTRLRSVPSGPPPREPATSRPSASARPLARQRAALTSAPAAPDSTVWNRPLLQIDFLAPPLPAVTTIEEFKKELHKLYLRCKARKCSFRKLEEDWTALWPSHPAGKSAIQSWMTKPTMPHDRLNQMQRLLELLLEHSGVGIEFVSSWMVTLRGLLSGDLVVASPLASISRDLDQPPAPLIGDDIPPPSVPKVSAGRRKVQVTVPELMARNPELAGRIAAGRRRRRRADVGSPTVTFAVDGDGMSAFVVEPAPARTSDEPVALFASVSGDLGEVVPPCPQPVDGVLTTCRSHEARPGLRVGQIIVLRPAESTTDTVSTSAVLPDSESCADPELDAPTWRRRPLRHRQVMELLSVLADTSPARVRAVVLIMMLLAAVPALVLACVLSAAASPATPATSALTYRAGTHAQDSADLQGRDTLTWDLPAYGTPMTSTFTTTGTISALGGVLTVQTADGCFPVFAVLLQTAADRVALELSPTKPIDMNTVALKPLGQPTMVELTFTRVDDHRGCSGQLRWTAPAVLS